MATITGTEGEDFLIGTAEDDTILGLGGNDRIRGEEGDDTIDGGAGGRDDARYETSTSGIVASFDVSTGTGSVEDGFGFTDTLISIERIRGSDHDDIITGGAGNERFVGNGGDDLLTGGDGFDFVAYLTSPSGVTVDLESGTASDGFGGTDTFSESV